LVLAHGWPWSSYSWPRIIPALARRYRVHWYDMPGNGRSDKGAGLRTSLDVQGEVFAAMLEHWQLSRPLVVAHDMGGAVTLRAHLLQGCDFERYVPDERRGGAAVGFEFFDHVGRHVAAFTGLPGHIHRAVVEAYIG
jgi:pimeloyl-ACP methyl ester carboxylesterase